MDDLDKFLAARFEDERGRIRDIEKSIEWSKTQEAYVHKALRLSYANNYKDHPDFKAEWSLDD